MKFTKKVIAFLTVFLMMCGNGLVNIPVAVAKGDDGDGGSGGGKSGTTLSATVTLGKHITHTRDWSISKSVDVKHWDLLMGDKAVSNYTVTVTKGPSVDACRFSGQVTVTNGGAIATENLRINLTLYKDKSQVDNLVLSPGELDVGQKGTYNYSFSNYTLNESGTYKVTADVTITNHSGHLDTPFGPNPSNDGITQTEDYSAGYDTVHVTDTNNPAGSPWTFSDSGSKTYSRTFDASAPGAYDNTATITETNQSASASVTVSSYGLDVSKTSANEAYTRKYLWDITKSGSTSSEELYVNQTKPVDYTVTVTATPQDYDFSADGVITIRNNTPVDAKLDSVADIPGAGSAVVDTSSISFPYTLYAGESLSLNYTFAAASLSDHSVVNTAKAVAKTYTRTKDGDTEIGTYDYTGSKTITFGDPTTVIDKEASVDDNQLFPHHLGDLTAPGPFEPFHYTMNVGPYPAPGSHQFDNTATVTTSDTHTTHQSSWTVNINMPVGTLRITKRDSVTGALLGGFRFGVYATKADADSGVNCLQTLTTNSDPGSPNFGTALSGDLALTGDTTIYWVKELPLPAGSGYLQNTNVYEVILIKGQTAPKEITINNDPAVGSITVTKKFTGDDNPADDTTFTFQLFENGVQVGEDRVLTWGKNGNRVTFTGLDYDHTYYVKELAKPGFDIDPKFGGDGYAVTISSPQASIECTNTKLYGRIIALKRDAQTKLPLEGVVFKLFDSDPGTNPGALELDMQTTGSSGTVIFGHLTFGVTYYVKEFRQLPGYDIVAAAHPVTVSLKGDVTTEFEDNELGKVLISKVDKETNAPLGGVEFKIADNSDFVNAITLTTQADGTVTSGDLVAGTWYVQETSAKAGYAIDDPSVQTVTVTLNGVTPVYFKDTALKGSIVIEKVDATNPTVKLPGAEFKLYSDEAATQQVGSAATTGTNGIARFDNLTAGTYYIRETTPPTNYDLFPGVIPATVTGGIAEPDPIVIKDTYNPPQEYQTGSIVIEKVNALNPAVKLAGAEFKLYSDEALTDQVGLAVTTGADGIARFDGLDAGTYYIKETKAPKNYSLFPGAIPATVVAGVDNPEPIVIKDTYNPPKGYQTGMMEWNLLLGGGLLLLAGMGLVILFRKKSRKPAKAK